MLRMKKLREYRNKYRLTQTELAEQIGIRQPTLCDYENGKKRPSPETAKKMEAITGIPRMYFIYGEESAQP